MKTTPFVYFLCLTTILAGCAKSTQSAISLRPMNSPAPKMSLVPQLTQLSNGKIALSWQERLAGGGYRFSLAIRNGNNWSENRTIASGPNLSMFTADLPGVAELPSGALLAYWELKDPSEGDRYATAIQTAVSEDEGRSWSVPKQPYKDALSGQHSFLAWFASPDGLGLVWLDAQQRAMVRRAKMQESDMGSVGLRYAHLDLQGGLTKESFIDPITCECCPTSAAVSARGPVVVYRGRQEPPGTQPSEVHEDRPTVRDIYITRLETGKWSKPHLLHPDNWVINACPDNGPSVSAKDNAVAVAWWTRSGDDPKVQVAFSKDAGDTFGSPLRIDAGKAEGQVTIALLPDAKGAVVGWLEGGQTWARIVSEKGHRGPPVSLGPSPRHSRLPNWIASKLDITAAWTSNKYNLPRVEVSRLDVH
jgi:hypothetical protein